MTHPEPETHPAQPKKVLTKCPDGHETKLHVASALARVHSITEELCLKPGKFGGVCGKYLKVTKVL